MEYNLLCWCLLKFNCVFNWNNESRMCFLQLIGIMKADCFVQLIGTMKVDCVLYN